MTCQFLTDLVPVHRAHGADGGVEAGDDGQPDAPLDASLRHSLDQQLLRAMILIVM